MIGSTFTLKGKTYRNLEAQVLENQKKSIKNEQDIEELKKSGPVYIEKLYGEYQPELGSDDLIALINQGYQVFIRTDSGYYSVDRYYPGGSISFTAINAEEGILYEYIIYPDRAWERFETTVAQQGTDTISRIIHDTIEEGAIRGADQFLPAYGATTLQEYFRKVGYIVCEIARDDGYILVAVCNNLSDDGILNFYFSEDENQTSGHYQLSYRPEILIDTNQLVLYFEDFLTYTPLGLNISELRELHDITNPINFDYFDISVGSTLTLPYTGSQMLRHPNLNIKIQTVDPSILENMYLKQGLYRNSNGTVTIGFDNTNSDYGSTLQLEGQADSNVFTVVYFSEV